MSNKNSNQYNENEIKETQVEVIDGVAHLIGVINPNYMVQPGQTINTVYGSTIGGNDVGSNTLTNKSDDAMTITELLTSSSTKSGEEVQNNFNAEETSKDFPELFGIKEESKSDKFTENNHNKKIIFGNLEGDIILYPGQTFIFKPGSTINGENILAENESEKIIKNDEFALKKLSLKDGQLEVVTVDIHKEYLEEPIENSANEECNFSGDSHKDSDINLHNDDM